MELRRHFGIICITIGLLLTMNETSEYAGIIDSLQYYMLNYWTVFIVLFGLYLVSSPKKKKK